MRIIMIVSFLIGCFVFWRTVFPLENKWFRLWGLPIFLAALKFPLLRLLGGPGFEKLSGSRVLVAGVGGVGGYAAEHLSGISRTRRI